MRDAIELLGTVTATGWKILCIAAVIALGCLILDRRGRPRVVRAVRRAEGERTRRAA